MFLELTAGLSVGAGLLTYHLIPRFRQGCGSAFISSGSSILGWIPIRIRIQYGFGSISDPGLQWQKITAENFFYIFFWSKTTIYLFLGLHKERPSYRKAFSSQKRTSNTSKHEFFEFFSTFVAFALLDPDPDSESGSTDPIESGSNTDPDPQPWLSGTCSSRPTSTALISTRHRATRSLRPQELLLVSRSLDISLSIFKYT